MLVIIITWSFTFLAVALAEKQDALTLLHTRNEQLSVQGRELNTAKLEAQASGVATWSLALCLSVCLSVCLVLGEWGGRVIALCLSICLSVSCFWTGRRAGVGDCPSVRRYSRAHI